MPAHVFKQYVPNLDLHGGVWNRKIDRSVCRDSTGTLQKFQKSRLLLLGRDFANFRLLGWQLDLDSSSYHKQISAQSAMKKLLRSMCKKEVEPQHGCAATPPKKTVSSYNAATGAKLSKSTRSFWTRTILQLRILDMCFDTFHCTTDAGNLGFCTPTRGRIWLGLHCPHVMCMQHDMDNIVLYYI